MSKGAKSVVPKWETGFILPKKTFHQSLKHYAPMPPHTQTPYNKAEILSLYANAGFTLFPLNGKIPPAGCHWRASKYNPFPSFKSNFGVQLQEEDLVIDVDPRNFGDVDSLAKLTSSLGELPDTFTIKTGSGGLHIYLKKPKEWVIRQGIRELPGIDFLSAGHYVVGAGSIHDKTGLPYEFANGTPLGIAQAPIKLLDGLKRREITFNEGTTTYVTDTQTQNRFISYLTIAPRAIEGQGGDRTTFAVAAAGHDYGLHPDTTLQLMADHYNASCEPPWSAEELKKKVYNAYKYSEGALGNKGVAAQVFSEVTEIKQGDPRYDWYQNGTLKTSQNNTVKMFLPGTGPLNALLGFNEFTQDIVFLREAPWHRELKRQASVWTDEEALMCQYWLSHTFKFEPSKYGIHDAAVVAAQQFPFHPVKDYLGRVKWDGHKRAHEWLVKHLGAEDNTYTRAVGLKFLVAAVMRIYEPGCKFDYIPVLEGAQGTGKSRTFNVLTSPWFSDQQLNIQNKDYVDSMRGQWIIELPEMETHYKSETQAMKAFLSRSTDRCRLPYARLAKDFPRQCVFVGTINPDNDEDLGYLKDTTGNRRYWPVKTRKIDLEALTQIRDQLWAEAVSLYKRKTPIYLDDEEIVKLAVAEQKKRLGMDAWHEKIEHWLDFNEIAKTQNIFTGQEIFTDCLSGKLALYTAREQRRIANIMYTLGWAKGVHHDIRINAPVRGYRRPAIR